jgi:fimbrial isopeptide formation D2 family protein/uncharacterized repeat protein (TIGR01451 family)/LPXTG-motif cell wall-anchored protein
MMLSLLLAVGTLGLATPKASAASAAVTITKAIDNKKDAYDKGDTVTYRLNIQCSSLEDPCVTGTLTDVLDPNLQYTSFTVGRNRDDEGVLSKAPVTLAQSGQTLTFTIGDASDPAKYFMDGETMDIVVNAKVIAVPANAGRTIDNSASIVSPGTPIDEDGPVTIVVNPEAAAVYDWALTKSKTAPSGNPAIGGNVTYDIRFTRPRNPDTGRPVAGGVDIASFVLKDAIPAGAEYVNAWSDYASGSASYDAGTNSVTFPSAAISASEMYCGDPCISDYVAHIIVKYPSPAYADGDQPINKATADITYADGHPNDTLTAEAEITLNEPTKSVSTEKWTGNSVHPTPGENVWWWLKAINTGNVGLESLIITDQIPAHLSNVQVGASDWYMPKHDGNGDFEYTLDGTNWLTLGTLDHATSTKLDVPAGAAAVRMKITDLAVDYHSGFQVFGTVDLDTPPGYVMENCMSYDGSVGPVLKSNCATYDIKEKPQARVETGKAHQISNGGSHVAPGDEFSWLLEWRTLATKVPTTSTVTDVLPSQFELITETPPCLEYLGYWEDYPTSCGATATTPAYTTEAVAGGTKITFTDAALPTLPNQYDYWYLIRLKVRVKDGAPAATYTNKMTVALPSNYEATCNWGNECSSTDDVVVDTAAAAGLQKWDKGTEPNVAQDTAQASANCPDWDGFTRYPCVAQTLPGGDFTYRLKWSNQGNVPLTDAVVYDVLPYVGDTGVGEVLSGADRKTEWAPVLTGPITLDAGLSTATGSGYVVEYNLTTNPCRPELKKGSADGTWQASCDDTWVTTVSDWSTVKSFRIRAFEASGAEWTPGTRMVFIIPMKAPADAPKSKLGPVDLSIAWNSAAQRVFQVRADGSIRLQATEPRKVGIIIPAPYVSIGDYVWYDANYNGQQDAGELPASGVKVTLKDSGGNVVGTTTTDADGYYWFQNLTEKAKYTLEFEKPSGYSWTTQNSGADKSDSDVDPTTSTISFTAPTWVEGVSKNLGGHDKADDPTLDAGLIKPIAQVSVGDYVWKDTDHDGIQDSGEPGIKGVVLTIKDESGNAVTDVLGHPVGSVTTDDNGYYLFPLLPVGHTYTVSIDTAASATALAGLAPTLANQGGDTAVDSSTGSATSVLMTTDGQKDLTLDFGFYDAPVSIGDYVWWDANRDGLQSATELPVAGVKVDLLDATGAPTGRTTTTDGQGYYWFNNLVAGQNYILKFTAPDGSTWTTQNASNDTSNDPATDKTDSDVNPANGQIAFTAPASGSNATGANVTDNPTLDGGLVKYNLVLAKSLDTAGPFVPGQDVTFTLTPHNDGPVAALAGWSVTDILPAGLTLKSMTGTDYDCTGATCTAKSALAAGADGPAITLVATIDNGFNGTAHNVAYVSPDADDIDETNPLVVPTTTTDTSKTDTDNDAQADLKVDLVSIGDYVWWDVDRDGQQDQGEAPVSGVTVNLLTPDGQPTGKTTTTDANGYYYFNNLQPNADFIVEFVKPTGSSFTTQTTGATASDSNPAIDTGYAPVKTPASGSNKTEPGQTDDPTIDAGLVKYNLTLSKSLDTAGPFFVGKDVTYTLIPHNDGPVAALAGWSVTDVLPAGLTFKSMSSTDASYTCSGATCTNNAALAANSNGPAITVVATVNADFTGVAHNVAYVSPAGNDIVETNPLVVPDTNTDTSKTNTDNDAQADLTVDVVSIGDYVWWDADRDGQQDAGEAPVPGITVNLLKDGQPTGKTTVTDANGYYAFGDLVPHTAYTVEFVKPADASFTTQTTGATASDSNPDVTTGKADVTTPDEGDNSLEPTKADDPTIDAGLVKYNLTLAKKLDTASPWYPGQTVTFTLTPHNDGPVAALAGWSVTEVVPSQLTFVSMTGDDYDCTGVTCVAKSPLAAGADGKSITVTATVNADVLGKIHNVAYVAPVSGDVPETNVLVVPDTNTDTSATQTDNDAQAELEVVPVSIGDYVWWDNNRDGQQTAGEPVEAEMTVNLIKGGQVVATTKTDANGYYAFKDLYPNTAYTVEFVKPDGSSFTTQTVGAVETDSNPDVVTGKADVTTPKTGSNLTEATKADDPTIDAGLVKLNLNLEKLLVTAGPFIPKQEVTFTLTPHNDGPSDALAGWSVTEVVPSQLTFVKMEGAGYTCIDTTCTADSILAAGAYGNPITVTATINRDALGDIHNVAYVSPSANEIVETNVLEVPDTNTDTSTSPTDNDSQAFLKVQPVSIGDYVWWDVDRDGQQDASEPVVPGVIVNLYDEFGALVGTTTTGDNGYYAFTSLQPGMPYSVEFIKPDGSVFTYQMQGDAASDSNADRATGKTPVFTTPTSGNNLATPGQADDPTIDAGLWSKINLVVAKHLATDGPFVQGDEITFYLSPSNEGPMDALAGWSVTEVLPEGLTLVSMSGDDYTCVDVTCTSTVQLAAGATGEPIKVVAEINHKAYGKVHNVAYVAPAPGEIPETNPLDVPGTDTNTSETGTDNDAQDELGLEPPAISLDKIAHLDDFNGNGYADAGETIRYTFKVTNIGGVRLAPVTISDDMLGLDDADCVDSLSVGESAICSTTGSYTVTSDDVEHRRSIDNTATTTGHVPGTPDTVTSTDDETVPVGRKTLPQTGGDIPLWAGVVAPLLLIAGAGLLFVGRRGRKTAGTTK